MKSHQSSIILLGLVLVVALTLLDMTNGTSIPRQPDTVETKPKQNNQSSSAAAACPMNYQPVCGSDGKTYSNKCNLENAKKSNTNLEFKKDGAC